MTQPANAIPRAYEAAAVERRIYQNWWDSGYFAPHANPSGEPFCIVMPPPNVTGELHLGHALTASLQDALTRWHRMRGDPTLWLPGKDHAGIATQWVVERALAEEGTNRHDLGRDAFEQRVWEWVERYGNTIDEQHRRLGGFVRLVASPVHPGSRPRPGGAHHLRQPLQQGTDLPPRTHHQLVPAVRHCPVGPGSRLRGAGRQAVLHPLSAGRPAGRLRDGRDDAAGVNAGRYRRGGPPGRRALSG